MVRNTLKAIWSRTFSANQVVTSRQPTRQPTSEFLPDGEVNCEALEERVLLSASPLPMLLDVEDIDTIEADVNIDDISGFESAFDAFNDAFGTLQESLNGATALDELVIIDGGVENADLLISDLQSEIEDGTVWVEFLDSGEDGIAQISELLARYEGLDTVHIVSHGQQGEVNLGNTSLTAETIGNYTQVISGWSTALADDADILVYGCDVAGTDAGEMLVESLAAFVGADVAASDDLTGHADLGGDWVLEYVVGDIESEVVFSEHIQASWQSSLQTFVVTTDNDSWGVGTLRNAIWEANNSTGVDTIVFDINGGGSQTIVMSGVHGAFDAITEAVVIDATSQGGFAGQPLIEIDANGAADSIFVVNADNVTIKGFNLHGAIGTTQQDAAITINGDFNTISDNYVGTDSTGAIGLGNANDGIHINGNSNTIDNNVLSANNDDGIGIESGLGNIISNNLIGTAADGTTALGNTQNGVTILAGADDQVIHDNVLSGNQNHGIQVASQGNQIYSNYIGTDSTGTVDLGNDSDGVYVSGQHNTIGDGSGSGGNTIAFNAGDGIRMDAGANANNFFFANESYQNDGLGINLVGGDETTIGNNVTTNDDLDGLKNFPILTSAYFDGTDLIVDGTVSAVPFTQYRLDIFTSRTADASGYGEGEVFLGAFTFTNDITVNETFSVTMAGISFAQNQYITATATELTDFMGDPTTTGHTSEFSQAFAMTTDAPTVDLDANNSTSGGTGFATTFTEGGAPANVTDSDVTITSVIDELTSAHVSISNLLDVGDELLTADATGTAISVAYNATTGVLMLSGPDTVANYEQVLQTVTYENTSNSPDTTNRSVSVTVDSGGMTSNVATSVVSVQDTPSLSEGVWFSIKSDGAINEGDINEVSDPNFFLEPTGITSGSVASVFNLELFDSSANVNAVHYVSSDVTVGGTNFLEVDLEAGDVLFSVDGTVTLDGVTVTRNDVALFEPDTIGNYSSGTFSVLLLDPLGENIRGLSLVEQDTDLVDTTVDKGTFLLTQQTPAEHYKVKAFFAEDVGANTAPIPGTPYVLIDGVSGNLGFGTEKIVSLEFVEESTIIGGVTIPEGRIIIGFDNDLDNLGSNDVDGALRQHMVMFDLTSTTAGSGVSNGAASILFDATDLGFTTNNDALDAFSFALNTPDQTPVVNDQVFSGNEHDSGFTAAVVATDPNNDIVQFDITNGDPGNIFAIDNSGVITVADPAAFDYESATSHALTVVVTDALGLSDSALITINVNDVLESGLSGSIYEDVNGDGDFSDDGFIGISGVSIEVYRDGGDQQADGGDDILVSLPSLTTDVNGNYQLDDLGDGLYWVVVDSRSITPSASLNAGFTNGDIWAEQTYGAEGALVADGSGGTMVLGAGGGRAFGGRTAGVSDDVTTLGTSEHVTGVQISGSNVTNVSSAFSYNSVTTIAGGDLQDDDTGNNRTMQGTLRQFIQNANAIAGANAMVFVPVDPTNDDDGGTNHWWEIAVTDALPSITDASTSIRGVAYHHLDMSIRDTNAQTLGYAGNVGVVDPGPDGIFGTGDDLAPGPDGILGNIDDATLSGVEAPELEIRNDSNVQIGFEVLADDTEIGQLSIHGFGSTQNAGNIVVGTNSIGPTGAYLHDNVLGSGPDQFASVAASAQQSSNIYVRSSDSGLIYNNLIGFSSDWGIRLTGAPGSSSGWQIVSNEIRGNASQKDWANGISVDYSSANSTIQGNLIIDNGGAGIDTYLSNGNNLIRFNTVSNNGLNGAEPSGIALYGNDNTVTNNVITNNTGAGVVVSSHIVNGVGGTIDNAAVRNRISQNHFGNNGGIAIDLMIGDSTDVYALGDGISLNDGSTQGNSGNRGFDQPVINSFMVETGSSPTIWIDAASPNNTDSIEFYLAAPNSGDDVSGTQYGEGEIYLGEIQIDSSAPNGYIANFLIVPPADGQITAIAIHNNGHTSEFSSVVDINYAPVASADSYTINEGASLSLVSPGVLANDADADTADNLTVSLVSDVSFGTLTLNSDGSFSYTHDGSETSATDSFVYEVSDGNGGTDTATVTFDITPSNDSPNASPDFYSVDEGGVLSIATIDGVLVNDSDDEGDPISAVLVSSTSNGSLTLNSDGSFSYVHDGSETSTDSFIYQARDPGNALSSLTTVTIDINPMNDIPDVVGETYTVSEGQSLTVGAATGVLANDSDNDGDSLTSSVVLGTTNGSLALSSDGSFVYIHDGSETMTDSFTYQVSDGNGGLVTAVADILVTPQNDSPIAVDDAYTVNEGGSISASSFVGLLLNDGDIEGDTLYVTLLASPSNGAVTVNPDGSFLYTHNGSETLSDQFQYEVHDGNGGTDSGTVSITVVAVNDSPVLTNNTTATVNENQFDAIAVTAIDPDPGQTLNFTISGGDDAGLFSVDSATGLLTFIDAPNFEAPTDLNRDNVYEVEVSVTDGQENASQHHSISVADINEAPVAIDDQVVVLEDGTFVASGFGVLNNDSDEDGDALANNVVGTNVAPGVFETQHGGQVLWNGDGIFTYIPAANFNGTDSFVYQVSDGEFTDFATVLIVVSPVNDAPDLTDDTSNSITLDTQTNTVTGFDSIGNNQILIGSLAEFGTDIDGDILSTTLIQGPETGTVQVNPDGSFVFTPDINFSGFEEFQFQFSDGQTTSDIVTAVIEITPEVGGGNGGTVTNTEGESDGGTESGEQTDVDTIAPPPSSVVDLDDDGEEDPIVGIFDFINGNDREFVEVESKTAESVVEDAITPTNAPTVFYVSAGSSVDNSIAKENSSTGTQLNRLAIQSRVELSSVLPQLFRGGSFGEKLDGLTNQLNIPELIPLEVVGATIATTGGVSVGYVLWTIRGGYLIGSLLSSQMPAWKMVDPLPILDFLGDDDDDNSLETIIANAKA